MIRVGMSTTCVYPLEAEQAFRLAKLAGFDGVEVMVTQEESTQRAEPLLELSRRYALPILVGARAGAAAHPLRVGTRPAREARAHRGARRRGRRRHRRGASAVPLAGGLRRRLPHHRARDLGAVRRRDRGREHVPLARRGQEPEGLLPRLGPAPHGLRRGHARLLARRPLGRRQPRSSRTTSATGCVTCTSATGRAPSARARSSTSTCSPGAAASPWPRCCSSSPRAVGTARSSPRSTPARPGPSANASSCCARPSSSPAPTRTRPAAAAP